jgi:hypothetical protein
LKLRLSTEEGEEEEEWLLQKESNSSESNKSKHKKQSCHHACHGCPSRLLSLLDGKLEDVSGHCDATPDGINWLDGENIQEKFSPVSECGKRQVPQCLLLDAHTAMDKLVVVSWWRGLTKEGQMAIKGLKCVHKRFTSSNEKLINDHWENVDNTALGPARATRCRHGLHCECLRGKEEERMTKGFGSTDKPSPRL